MLLKSKGLAACVVCGKALLAFARRGPCSRVAAPDRRHYKKAAFMEAALAGFC
jgi:hypothetical protein